MTAKLNFRSALFLLLPVLFLTFGCKDMKLDIQDLKDRLYVLEGTTITSINEQISAINTSISDLKEMDESLDTYIKALEATATDLQKQINDANAEIAKVEAELGEEISVLEQSLLNELKTAKEAIEAEILAINNTLAELKKADEALDKKISNLQAYVDTQLTSTTNWANATFSTLAQYEQTQTEISTIKASIEQINTDIAALETRLNGKIVSDIQTAIDALRIEVNADHASRIESSVNNLTVAYTAAISSARTEITTAYTNAISNAIIASESGMKAWVNSVLTQGYYDIATIDGKLSALSARLDETDTDLQKQITEQKNALEASKEELTKAYQNAIKAAIEENNGVINAAIAEAVQKLETKINSRLSTIESQITAMQKGIDEIIDDIDTIQKQIESINFILENLEDVDEELRLLIDKLLSDYAALLQELEEIRPIDEISKKTIVDDIALLKEQVVTIFSKLDTFVLKEDFVNRIQSLKYIPEFSDGKAKMSDFYKTISLDFLVSPSNQAKAVQNAWETNQDVVTAFLRCTKNPETKAISPAVQLLVTSVVGNADGTLNVTLKEDSANPIDTDFFTGDSDAVVYIQISDGNSDVFSDMVEVKSCIELSVYEDLSPLVNGVYQTANCYIVTKAGSYKFKAYKGNSQELAGSLESAIHPRGTITHAKVLWESFGTEEIPMIGDLIKVVDYEDGYVVFETPAQYKEGNAVIAVRDESGNVLWSWHIWLTDQPQEQVYYNNAGTMMDRNLGATSTTPGDVRVLGMVYQWGRKDPFLNSTAMSNNTTMPEGKLGETNEAIAQYILHPTQTVSVKNWYYQFNRGTMWSLSKTIYDPCPSQWHIPTTDIWYNASSVMMMIASKYPIDSVNNGIDFSKIFGDCASIWYPIGGYWSDEANVNYGWGLYICNSTYSVDCNYAHNVGATMYVRCMKE